MNIELLVTGDRQAEQTLDRLGRRLEDGTPALYDLVDRLLEVHQERFTGRGQRWRKLDPATLRIDRQQGRDPRPNVLTGALMRSLTIRDAPGQLVRVTPNSLTFGTRIWYAQFAKKLRRNPVGMTREQRKQFAAELKRLLLKNL